MIEATLTSITQNLDRIADALERISAQQAEAVTIARLETLERKTAALSDGLPAPGPVHEPAPAPAPAPDPAPDPAPVATAPLRAEEPAAAKITHDDVRAAGKHVITTKGVPAFKAVLRAHGVDTVSALAPEALPAVLAALDALTLTE